MTDHHLKKEIEEDLVDKIAITTIIGNDTIDLMIFIVMKMIMMMKIMTTGIETLKTAIQVWTDVITANNVWDKIIVLATAIETSANAMLPLMIILNLLNVLKLMHIVNVVKLMQIINLLPIVFNRFNLLALMHVETCYKMKVNDSQISIRTNTFGSFL